MNVIYSVKDYLFNQATVSGAIDIIVVRHEDGSYRCSPFHVHFGKMELKKNTEKQVVLKVNGSTVEGVHMKLGAAGEAFFVDSVESPVEEDYSTSPLASPSSSPVPSRGGSPSQPSTFETVVRRRSISPPAPEWHDAYRLVPEGRMTRRESHGSSDRLTWGWGTLPMVRTASVAELNGLSEESRASGDNQPRMVKNESIYFDALETVTLNPSTSSSDPPCMSLCGHLLEKAESREQAHTIFSEHIVPYEVFKENPAEMLQDDNLRFLVDGKIYPFNNEIQAYLVSRVLFPNSQPPVLTSAWAPKTRSRRSSGKIESGFWFDEEGDTDVEDDDSDCSEQDTQPSRRWFQWLPRSSSDDESSPLSRPLEVGKSLRSESLPSASAFYRKTLVPTQDDLEKMNLRYGTNEIEFVVCTADCVHRVSAKLYLWPVSAKIILAEIDGAISRQPSGRRLSTLLPIMERDTAGPHRGALDFYARAARNGYRIVYLTGRGLSQADLIHDMLRSSDKSKLSLPNGPVLLSPERLLETSPDDQAVTKDFKVDALNGIRALFPTDVNPFYAAFGKTYADSAVFTQAGVFPGKVFLVDEGDGRLRHQSIINFKESYSSLLDMVDKMFPPICSPSPSHKSMRPNSQPNQLVLHSSSAHACPSPIKRVHSATENLVSDVVSSHVQTRSMGDEAYNDVNFWRIEPGRIDF
ncbi:hypothetical protein Poli38472_011535 [Pythium oligandrum]|uniref:phosphatidate phosphatase n=1 Tax=Pythium oligandrum TaxID=41045 RepID=A0A8K1CL45_PYTOL|nr:hypothetical protein Poli38472_011535 [Pythium oligandrum]|eukprot:TMW64655.1 hypothetical protein Poli38472_011535 [Pythium oligandrum]